MIRNFLKKFLLGDSDYTKPVYRALFCEYDTHTDAFLDYVPNTTDALTRLSFEIRLAIQYCTSGNYSNLLESFPRLCYELSARGKLLPNIDDTFDVFSQRYPENYCAETAAAAIAAGASIEKTKRTLQNLKQGIISPGMFSVDRSELDAEIYLLQLDAAVRICDEMTALQDVNLTAYEKIRKLCASDLPELFRERTIIDENIPLIGYTDVIPSRFEYEYHPVSLSRTDLLTIENNKRKGEVVWIIMLLGILMLLYCIFSGVPVPLAQINSAP
jgi:hypothetical protein